MAPPPQERTGVVRIVSPQLQGGRSYAEQLADIQAAVALLRGNPPPSELQVAQPEGRYDPKTMTWEGQGGRHSQRCNARRQTENGPQNSSEPDFY